MQAARSQGPCVAGPGPSSVQSRPSVQRWVHTRAGSSRRAAHCSSRTASTAVHLSVPTAAEPVKASLLEALHGLTDRGIFGIPAAKKAAILQLVKQLEEHNPVKEPIHNLDLVDGNWKLLYSTITITGSKRTKLGLREFIKLGDFTQQIDVASSLAVNRVEFNAAGMIKGALTIKARYSEASPQRVTITFEEATLAPAQLQALFEANLPLLLSIFNPEGWLDVTYLDAQHRVGRDDKGNVFLLQRAEALAGPAAAAAAGGDKEANGAL